MTLAWVLVVLAVATFVRSAFGFGEALIAVPLLALVMPVEAAAPLAVLVSIAVALVAVVQDWREVAWRSAAVLVAASCAGIPLGLWLLTALPEAAVKTLLAGVIIAFSLYFLAVRVPPRLRSGRLAPLFGFVAGVLGGAYGMNGPPLVAWGSLRGWSPQRFRATLQAYFLPASALVLGGYALTGLWTAQVTRHFLWSLPVVALATLAGRSANRRFRREPFLLAVHLGLVLVGLALLLQAWR